MKVKALASGFDGKKAHEAGATLEGNSDYIKRALFNGAAEPLDKEAKDYLKQKDEMTDKDVKANPMYAEAIVNMVRDLDTIDETLSVRKKGVKKATKRRK